jgi:hypothetical protein
MGCFLASKSQAEALLLELKQKKSELSAFEFRLSEMNGGIADSDSLPSSADLSLSYSSLTRTSYLFPSVSLANTPSPAASPSLRSYIEQQLKFTEAKKTVVESLVSLTKHLKKKSKLNAHRLSSTIATLEEIISQDFPEMKEELAQVKVIGAELSSVRGGTFFELVKRIEAQCTLSKTVEGLQGRIEKAYYVHSLEEIGDNTTEVSEKMGRLIEMKKALQTDLEEFQSEVDYRIQMEVEPLQAKNEAVEAKIKAVEIKKKRFTEICNKEKVAEVGLKEKVKYLEEMGKCIEDVRGKIMEAENEKAELGQKEKLMDKLRGKVEIEEKRLEELLDKYDKLISGSPLSPLPGEDIASLWKNGK